MGSIKEYLKDALKYPFSDWRIILLIGTLMFVISLLRKLSIHGKYLETTIFIICSILMFLEVGYGSKIAATSIRGDAKPPKFNKIPKLIWEGFKKVTIITIYGVPLHYLFYQAKTYTYIASPICLIFYVLFIFVYIILILGLINRYTYRGSFIKAFDFREFTELFKKIKNKNLVFILICAMIAQIFAIQTLIDMYDGFYPIELYYVIISFFLAPFMLITTKRFIALNVRESLNIK